MQQNMSVQHCFIDLIAASVSWFDNPPMNKCPCCYNAVTDSDGFDEVSKSCDLYFCFWLYNFFSLKNVERFWTPPSSL